VPALRLQGRFTARQRAWDVEIWILADSTHPLVLKVINGPNVLQTVRVDLPNASAEAARLEHVLMSTCRVELPGIYFAFNSAVLEPASDPAIVTLAGLLARHPDWTATVEGHTDSIGSATRNQELSAERAEVVRTRLVTRHGIDGHRLRASGRGASSPRESNATIEGRARNRRVEVVRACAGRQSEDR
jgi:outer membrane protein OmpA-like peptidoglycan-associated protein